ncbi:MAG: hypothetical protein GC154_01355, partial [bacterium]|nr:hypothetical protein [bacterium]
MNRRLVNGKKIGFVLLLAILLTPVSFAQVVINEIMYHPFSNPDDGEYIELYNAGDSEIDLSGWRFTDGIQFKIPAGTKIAADGYVVVCRNELFIRDFYKPASSVVTVGNYADSSLSNDGEAIILENAMGERVDKVEYGDSSPWPNAADGGGASLELLNAGMDNDDASAWKASLSPTPGRANSQKLATPPPNFVYTRRVPESPAPNQAVRVESRVKSANDITQMTLFYSLNGAPALSKAMTLDGN